MTAKKRQRIARVSLKTVSTEPPDKVVAEPDGFHESPMGEDKARIDERKRVGKLRMVSALHHVQEAIDQLFAASRDLCSVIGANREYHAITQAAYTIKREVRPMLEDGAHNERVMLDRDPHPDNINHGCGTETAEKE